MVNVFSATGPQGPQGSQGRMGKSISTAVSSTEALTQLQGGEFGVSIVTGSWDVYELDGTGTTLAYQGNIKGGTGDRGTQIISEPSSKTANAEIIAT